MSKSTLVRATSATIVAGVGVVLAPLAFAAPASAFTCNSGDTVVTTDYLGTVTSCGFGTNFFGVPIQVVKSGNNQTTITFGVPPLFTLGFGDQLVFYFGGKRVVPVATGTNAAGQPTATFPAGSVPANGQGVTVQVVKAGGGGAQGSAVPASSSRSVSAVPNGSAVARDALTGTSTSSSAGFGSYSINSGVPGDSTGPNAALIAGGAALMLVALGGGVFMVRRRNES